MRNTPEEKGKDEPEAQTLLWRREGIGLWEWLSLYLTGVFLLVFLGAHIWAVHYARASGEAFTFREVMEKLSAPLFQALDIGLLALALYHGLAGVRRVVVDMEVLSPRGERCLLWALVAVGLLSLVSGIQIFRAFLSPV